MQCTFHDEQSAEDLTNNEKALLEHKNIIASIVEVRNAPVPESVLTLPFLDYAHIESIAAECMNPAHVVVIGIGGSSLGIEAVYEALAIDTTPKFTVLDTSNETAIASLVRDIKTTQIPREKLTICIISKSGNTVETIANSARILTELTAHFGGPLGERVVVISNPDSPLQTFASTYGAHFVPMPVHIGGRYSVFTSVGIVPMTLLGFDVPGFLSGARATVEAEILGEGTGALTSAATLFARHERKEGVLNIFTLSNRFHALGSWFEQLHGESMGKNTKKDGTPVEAGMIPKVTALNDLHSVGQLFFGGGRGIFTKFIVEKKHIAPVINEHPILAVLPYLNGKTLEEIRDAISEGTQAAYREQKIPHMVFALDTNASDVGAFMAFSMIETMLFAELSDINAFDQPNVELYKKHTRGILDGNGHTS